LRSNLPLLDPESILRKPRKRKQSTQAQDRPESPTRGQPNIVQYPCIGYSASKKSVGEETSVSSQETDPQTKFNRSWGYLPPLDDEALTIINEIIANPDMGKDFPNIRPDHKDFSTGLEHRNIFLNEPADKSLVFQAPTPTKKTSTANI
jgi:hypothetical protein